MAAGWGSLWPTAASSWGSSRVANRRRRGYTMSGHRVVMWSVRSPVIKEDSAEVGFHSEHQKPAWERLKLAESPSDDDSKKNPDPAESPCVLRRLHRIRILRSQFTSSVSYFQGRAHPAIMGRRELTGERSGPAGMQVTCRRSRASVGWAPCGPAARGRCRGAPHQGA